MAKMIPELVENFNGSEGEKLVYESLKSLGDEIVVFHSLGWKRLVSDGNYENSYSFNEGEADFVIYNPRRGFVVLEVKSGILRCEEGMWYQKNRNTFKEIKLRKSPQQQADNARYTLIDMLNKAKIKERVGSAVWLTSLKKSEINFSLPHDFPEQTLLLKEDLANPEKAINRAFDFYQLPLLSKANYNKSKRIEMINFLSPKFGAIPTGTDIIDFNEQNFSRMTNEQFRILDFLVDQRDAAIMGGAGTGKTLLAIEKAKRLSNEKVLFLCYNSYLKDELREKMKEYKNIEVHNLQSLLSRHKNTPKLYNEEEITEFLLSERLIDIGYKHIIIDEGQDINVDHVDLLQDIAFKTDGNFYLFFDKNQLIQNWNERQEWKHSIPCQLFLAINCRNTRNIASASHSLLELKNPKIRSDIEGIKPNFILTEDKADEVINLIDDLIESYIQNGFKHDDITILTINSLSNSVLTDIKERGNYSISTNTRKRKTVLFTTARKFKGLESEIIILIDVNNEIDDEYKRLFYVASSRAKTILDVIYSDTELAFNNFVTSIIKSNTVFKNDRLSKYLNVNVIGRK